MTSYLITSSDKAKRDAYTLTIIKERNIDLFDITILALETEEKSKKTPTKQSIGIEEIKQLQQKLYLKPVRSPEKAIIIQDAHILTVEAQNALLKTLEEPPEQTVIFLVTESVERLLPTILSRCSLILLEEEKKEMKAEDIHEINEFIATLPHFSISHALGFAEKIGKSKIEAASWLEKVIVVMRETHLLTANESSQSAGEILTHLQKTHTLIKTTNVNVRMALETAFLAFV